ncbi:MAG TPA: TIGR02757 family protein, partial [Bacteroidales bacterium]|nr:TIGR02757 family protein [Bacteroidales bacterium]
MKQEELKEFLDSKYVQYGDRIFIENDPVQIPHQYSKPGDIEIAGFLTAIIAWGQRKTIIRNANQLMQWMDFAPHDFMLNHQPGDLKPFETFTHRTFNGVDCVFFVRKLSQIYREHLRLEDFFNYTHNANTDMATRISDFKRRFFLAPHALRSEKHLADPLRNSAAKRLNMFFRWMVRRDPQSVDFGIWKNTSPALLMCPLDVHTARISRSLGLLQRKQNDWKAVEELTHNLRQFDQNDPV